MTSGGIQPHFEALYFLIAKDAIQQAEVASDEFARKKHVTVALVFAALSIEGYTNQAYNAVHLSAKTHQSLLQRVRNYPTVVDPAAPPLSMEDEPLKSVQRLLYIRNKRLVHFDPGKELRLSPSSNSERFIGELIEDLENAKRLMGAVADTIRLLHQHSGGTAPEPRFLDGAEYVHRVWATMTAATENLKGVTSSS